MRDAAGRNAPQVADVKKFAHDNKVDMRPIELDVSSEKSIEAAIRQIVAEQSRLDVLMHNAGHMVFGPAEAFKPGQLAELYDINVLSTQRVNRVALPQMRKQHQGLLIWVSSSSSAGGTPPYLAPYFASKAGMDAMAVQYARELALWGIETSIIVPGAFTGGTNHFAHSASPADKRSEEHTSELQSRLHLVCRLLLEKKKKLHESSVGSGATANSALSARPSDLPSANTVCQSFVRAAAQHPALAMSGTLEKHLHVLLH